MLHCQDVKDDCLDVLIILSMGIKASSDSSTWMDYISITITWAGLGREAVEGPCNTDETKLFSYGFPTFGFC